MVKSYRRLLIAFLILLLTASFLFAQQDDAVVTPEDETVGVTEIEEEFVFEDIPDMGWLEVLARKIVGSGLVDLFIQGGFAMWPLLILLVWAIGTIIWKLVVLSYARINTNELLSKVMPLVEEKKFRDAAKICEETRGPVAMVLHLALLKAEDGLEAVEKAIESAASLELSYLDKGFISLSTTINLAPMLGFFGTVVGMIAAFDAIALAGEVDPTIVASGIKIALITTASGLAIAIPVQFFNNMFMGMVDNLVIDMQKASESLVETLVQNK
ncbi:MAG: MotA/TolQ/ExbB proton channel family protein [Candidatus Cloacimonetes bacterium]|nr:MotA/TolQ/ExbB proton channel family protein [Candidatus Cloacimonadota bacterium]